jgi:beta-phosphoglucomutase-like phosphatase (HAD superfamily)
MIKLVIFDMDGVLADSEPAITMASIESLREAYGIEAKHEDFKEFTGMGDDKFIQGVAAKYGKPYDVKLKERAYEIYTEKKDRVKIFPKAKDLIHDLYASGLQCAVASASDLVKVKVNIEKIELGDSVGIITTDDVGDANPRRCGGTPFQKGAMNILHVITGTDVKNKKPDPEIFLKAAQAAGVSSENAIVIEDAVSGVQAAKSAGMTCIGVTTSFDRRTLLDAGADYVVNELYDAFDVIKSVI